MADEREGGLGATRRTLDRAVLDATVSQLKELERRSGLERMIAIGRLILEQFFDGSAAAWRERRKNKNNSVRRLAEHASCPFSHSSLNQALGIYVTVRALPSVQTFKHVGACHIIAVLHLTEAAQWHWLERAEQGLWSVRQLKAAVLESRRLEGERRGRPRTSVGRARVARLKRSLLALERELSGIADVPLNPSEREELVRIVELLQGFMSVRELYLGSATERLVPEEAARVKAPRVRMVAS